MNLSLPTPEQLRAAYEQELISSFPPSELKPLSAIEKMWAEGCYRPWCLFQGRHLAGLAFLWLGAPGWGLLDYLCVPAAQRNGGTGRRLLRLLQEASPGMTILAETEDPPAAPDPDMAARRLNFYARCGARQAPYQCAVFGVEYRVLYWADREIPPEALLKNHRMIYQKTFTPEKYRRFVHIPLPPGTAPPTAAPWNQ